MSSRSAVDVEESFRTETSSLRSAISSLTRLKDDASPTEESPLLPTASPPSVGELVDLPNQTQQLSPRRIVVYIMVIIALTALGEVLCEAPQTRIFESIYCYEHWELVDRSKLLVGREGVGPGAVGGVEEHWCKIPQVQARVALLKGYLILLDGFPCLLLAVPFGIAADRIGRRPFLLLGLCSFPLRYAWIQFISWFWQGFNLHTIWFSSLHGIMGGSGPVATALVFVIVSDVTTEADRAQTFLRMAAANLAESVFVPPLSAFLMTINPWIPNVLGLLSFVVAAAFMMLFVPETIDYCIPQQRRPRASIKSTGLTEDIMLPLPDIAGESPPTTSSYASRWIMPVKGATSFLAHDWRVPALLFPFIANLYLNSAFQILLQYASMRYHLTFSRATLLLATRAGFMVLTLLVLLPGATHIITKRLGLDGRRKDLYLARASALAMCAGWWLVASAPNVPMFIIAIFVAMLGSGFALLVRSFMTSLVEPHNVAKLYTLISVIDTLGLMLAGPLLAGLFNTGLELGGAGLGLPFWFTGGLFALIALLLFVVRIRNADEHWHEQQDEEGEE